ncbi:hypothetical protein HY501_00650 [Candidatus Woesearchaeota archaeon]|nr:hypothetical protein [Candidatus Woesearchaeota archaeon]
MGFDGLWKRRFLAAFCLLLIFPVVAQTLDFNPNGGENLSGENETSLIELQLTKTKYLVNDTVQGNLILHFSEEVDPDLRITIRAPGGYYREFTLMDMLDNLSIPYEVEEGAYNLSNPASEKLLSFVDSGSSLVGMQVPEFSGVVLVNLTLTDVSGNLEEPLIDIGDDGIIDWHYLGTFQNYLSEYAEPEGLAESGGDISLINDNITLQCQLIQFPFSKHFEIAANYRKLPGTSGNITVVILERPNDFNAAEGGAEQCDLPEENLFGWHSCPITLTYAEEGEALVCVYSSNGTGDMYELKADTSDTTDTAFNCVKEGESFACTPVTFKDYYLKVRGAEYDNSLAGSQRLSDWQTAPRAALEAFEKYIGSVGSIYDHSQCTANPCPVPIRVYANNSGNLKLEAAKVVYDFEGTGTTQSLYSIERFPRKIVEIQNQRLSGNLSVTVPLSYFNIQLKRPQLQGVANTSGFVEAGVNGELDEKEKFILILEIVGGSKNVIDGAKAVLSKAEDGDYSKLLQILGVSDDGLAGKLTLLEERLYTEGDSEDLVADLQAELGNFPWVLEQAGSIKDTQFVEEKDIPSSLDKEILFLQDAVSVTTTFKSYTIADSSGEREVTLVRKEVRANQDLEGLEVFEVIAKNVAGDVSAILFEETPLKIVEPDPIVKWSIPSLHKNAVKNYYYVLPGKTGRIEDALTFISFEEAEVDVEPEPGSECGDGICLSPLEDETTCTEDCAKPKTLLWVMIVAVLFLVLLAYLVFYRGKYHFGKLFAGKSPFAQEKELKSIMDYIKKQRGKGERDDEIRKRLMEKGWSEKQVKFAFDELAWNKGPESHEDSPLMDYIKQARGHGKSDEEILNALLSKGWKEGDVKEALKK